MRLFEEQQLKGHDVGPEGGCDKESHDCAAIKLQIDIDGICKGKQIHIFYCEHSRLR
jgi:hypothetical protein